MQTIKVESIATTYGVAFSVKDGNFLASVGPDSYNPGRWATGNPTFGACNNCTFADAVEFISDAVCNHFAAYGLNVEFIH